MVSEADPAVKLAGIEGVDDLSLEAFRAFRDVMRLNGQALVRGFGAQGAHHGQAACLRVLDAHDGITQKDMAETLQVSRPTITAMLQAVEKSGAVIRKPDEADQRLTRVYLTEEGREMATKLRHVLVDYINGTFAALPEKERRELIRVLGHLGENMKNMLETTEKGTCG